MKLDGSWTSVTREEDGTLYHSEAIFEEIVPEIRVPICHLTIIKDKISFPDRKRMVFLVNRD